VIFLFIFNKMENQKVGIGKFYDNSMIVKNTDGTKDYRFEFPIFEYPLFLEIVQRMELPNFYDKSIMEKDTNGKSHFFHFLSKILILPNEIVMQEEENSLPGCLHINFRAKPNDNYILQELFQISICNTVSGMQYKIYEYYSGGYISHGRVHRISRDNLVNNLHVMKFIHEHLQIWLPRCVNINVSMRIIHRWMDMKKKVQQESNQQLQGLPEDIQRTISSFYEWKDTYEMYNFRYGAMDMAVYLRNEKYEIYFVDSFQSTQKVIIYDRELKQMIDEYEFLIVDFDDDSDLIELFQTLEKYNC
jgi:hypothetical protein